MDGVSSVCQSRLNSERRCISCIIASGLSPPPYMPAACSWKNEPLVALIRCATCVADPLFPRIAPRYFIVFSLVNTIPFSTRLASSFFNNCTEIKKIPKIWRQAKVVALLKPGKDPFVAKSFRPISLVCHTY